MYTSHELHTCKLNNKSWHLGQDDESRTMYTSHELHTCKLNNGREEETGMTTLCLSYDYRVAKTHRIP